MTAPFNPSAPNSHQPSDEAAAWALKQLAARNDLRSAFLESPHLSQTLLPAAARYIVAADIATLLPRLDTLSELGYCTGVEQVGEEARTRAEVQDVVDEYSALLDRLKNDGQPVSGPIQIGFDLSNVGMLESRKLAESNTARLLDQAAQVESNIIISMERSEFVDQILETFFNLAADHHNVAITLQAHLHRTPQDLTRVLETGRKIRLVKGVYREQPSVALARGTELDDRYMQLFERIVVAGVPVAAASQDERLLQRLHDEGLLAAHAEVEMLHGVQPHVLRHYRDKNVRCRVATVYGDNWWLHFLHRLSEHPPNVITALADIADPGRVRFASQY